jgi:predicted  nucleic acid-binding Zn-ribbon protein
VIQLNLDDIEAVLDRANDDADRVSVYEYREALNAVYQTAMRILVEKMTFEVELTELRGTVANLSTSLDCSAERHIWELEDLRCERDEARATLAFLQDEYGKATDETLTRDALELKIRVLEQQLSSIRKAVYDLRVLRSSCEDSYDGEFRVHLIEDEYNALIKLASE